jgi:homoserine acetyltransferase
MTWTVRREHSGCFHFEPEHASAHPTAHQASLAGPAGHRWDRGGAAAPLLRIVGLLRAHTAELLHGLQHSATFIGWSLGGIYARELAKTMGARVRQVITIGTPFKASADQTSVRRRPPPYAS